MPNVESALQAAIQHHMGGRLDEARMIYERIIAAEPRNPDALHLLGVVACGDGAFDTAIQLITRALDERPGHPGFLKNLGAAYRGQGNLDEAMGCYRQALEHDPGFADAAVDLAMVLMQQGRTGAAADHFRKALALRPADTDALEGLGIALLVQKKMLAAIEIFEQLLFQNPGSLLAHHGMATACRGMGKLDEAIGHYEKVLALAPESAEIHSELGNAHLENEDLGRALDHCRTAVELDPGQATVLRGLGNALRDAGSMDDAVACYRRELEIKRSGTAATIPEQENPWVDAPTFSQASAFKLRHDIEQFRYLMAKGVLAVDFENEVTAYESVLADLGDTDSRRGRTDLNREQRLRIGATYNRLIHMAEAPAGRDGPLNRGLDVPSIEGAYFRDGVDVAVVDGLLSAEALDTLRRFCLESTIWYDFYHDGGYLGAYLQDGFNCDLLMTIARDLRRTLPGIIGDHRLRQMWAYKYDSRMTGIPMHADEAAVNVNFWITPDDANLDADGGGLVVYPREAPLDWDFDKYNNDQSAIQAFIAGCEPVTVAHRQNRAVIFNSDYFHRTGDLNFKDGYENRRINVTLLYGWRDGKGQPP